MIDTHAFRAMRDCGNSCILHLLFGCCMQVEVRGAAHLAEEAMCSIQRLCTKSTFNYCDLINDAYVDCRFDPRYRCVC